MTMLVTGGTGLLGRAVLEQLSAGSATEIVATRRPGRTCAPIDGVTWVEQDLSRRLGNALPARVDAVAHLAHSTRYREFPDGAIDVFAVNAAAAVNLLDYSRRAGAQAFVLGSSGAVYSRGPLPHREDDQPHPPSFYGRSKLAAEHAAFAFTDYFDVKALRYFFVYGSGQDERAFIPSLAWRVHNGEDIELGGADGMRCNPIHVDEAAHATLAAMECKGSGIFNIAGPETLSIREIAEHLGARANQRPRFLVRPAAGDLIADTTCMQRTLFVPRIGLREGLDGTTFAPSYATG